LDCLDEEHYGCIFSIPFTEASISAILDETQMLLLVFEKVHKTMAKLWLKIIETLR